MNKTTSLVTGGAGFIGSHLCRKLLSEGNRVICLDNLYTGSWENIEELLSNENFLFIRQDVTEPFDIPADRIYHLACPASPIHYQTDPVYTSRTNFLGALNVLENARKYDARVLLASTSEVYGDPLEHPQREEYRGNVNPTGPRSCYDEGKRMAETLFFDHHRMYNTDIKVIRIFNTYGPNMSANDGRVVSNFITQALHSDRITVYGDGSQTRSFCYVSDLLEGMTRMMDSEDFTGPVNLGNPQEIRVGELAEIIREMTGTDVQITYQDLPEDDPTRRRPDITLAKEKLNWQPQVDLRTGLSETIRYFQQRASLG